jgi:hypothetical protein
MDCGISPDGKTLIISRANFVEGEEAPRQSDLLMANRDSSGRFKISPQSELFLKSINTPALEYAPAISSDGLELYFTRLLSDALSGQSDSLPIAIMVAKRTNTETPFGVPARIAAITGFAEAPSITLDKREMFYHKKDGNLFRIYRVKRSE